MLPDGQAGYLIIAGPVSTSTVSIIERLLSELQTSLTIKSTQMTTEEYWDPMDIDYPIVQVIPPSPLSDIATVLQPSEENDMIRFQKLAVIPDPSYISKGPRTHEAEEIHEPKATGRCKSSKCPLKNAHPSGFYADPPSFVHRAYNRCEMGSATQRDVATVMGFRRLHAGPFQPAWLKEQAAWENDIMERERFRASATTAEQNRGWVRGGERGRGGGHVRRSDGRRGGARDRGSDSGDLGEGMGRGGCPPSWGPKGGVALSGWKSMPPWGPKGGAAPGGWRPGPPWEKWDGRDNNRSFPVGKA